MFKLVDYVYNELEKNKRELNSDVKENSLKILNLLLKYGGNPDFIPLGQYRFNSTEYAEYKDIDYLASELYRNGSDVQTKSQNVGVGSISNKILAASKGLVFLAKEEFTKFLNNVADYELLSKLDSNTLSALSNFKLNYDSKKKSFSIDYIENDKDYEQRKIDYKDFYKNDKHSDEKFSKSYVLNFKPENIDKLLKNKIDSLNGTSLVDIAKIQSKLLTTTEFKGNLDNFADIVKFLDGSDEFSDELLGNKTDFEI